MRLKTRVGAAGLIALVLLLGIVGTGLSFSPVIYGDLTSGLQVNRSAPELTLMSYYDLLSKQSFSAACKLLTPAGQKDITPETLANQIKGINIQSAQVTKAFPARQLGQYAVAAVIWNLRLPGTVEDKTLLIIGFLRTDSFQNRWSVINSSGELPQNLQVSLLKEVIELEKSISTDFSGRDYTRSQVEMIKSQLNSQIARDQGELQRVQNSETNAPSLPTVNPAKSFIANFSPQGTALSPGQYNDVQSNGLPPGHPSMEK